MSNPERVQPQRRRRWLRFSLRTLLLLTAVFAVWLGVQVNKAHRFRKAVARIQENNGTVVYDWVRKNRLPTPMFKEQYALVLERKREFVEDDSWLAAILGSEYFDRVEAVHFAGDPNSAVHPLEQRVSQECLDALGDLPDLVELHFYGGIIEDDGVQKIAECDQLEVLHLVSFRVTDRGIRHLSSLKNLQKLVLYAPRTSSDAVVETVKGLPDLEEFYLSGTPVTEAGLSEIREALPNCRIGKGF